ncbi:hypothetical protein EXIGLDRAFT_771604 [Exidia glandulosa HHB12029]|uniref:F-box domain-containing protein n=1 Tax=Exidia glandulosa HHB12029 TaxID=1314781 RepID=A0A165FW26_EXIGL|nr:hypothetical protein EXIGLDRAFT_771604 [Exidia glandulosa HHB12029]
MPLGMTWASLSPELLSIIHKMLVDDRFSSRVEDRFFKFSYGNLNPVSLPPLPLAHAALVNRHWHNIATEHLYGRIFVHTPLVLERLVQSLSSNEELPYFIRYVTLCHDCASTREDRNSPQARERERRAWQFLNLLLPGRLIHLAISPQSVTSGSPDSLDASYSSAQLPCLPRLVSLTMLTWPHTPMRYLDFTAMLRRWMHQASRTLSYLSIPDVPLLADGSSAFPATLKLRGLHAVHGRNIDFAGLCASISHETLESLSLRMEMPDRANRVKDALIALAPRLQALHLSSSVTITPFTEALPHFHRLHTLFIALNDDHFDIFLSHIPSSLRRLEIVLNSMPWSNPLDFHIQETVSAAQKILQLNSLSSLSRLMMTNSYPDSNFPFMSIDHTVFESTIALAATRDITLTFMELFPRQLEW